jgi:ribosomal protein S27AE
MKCPKCKGHGTVIDSRHNAENVRRRRQCDKCGYRYTTYEITEEAATIMANVQRRLIDLIAMGEDLIDLSKDLQGLPSETYKPDPEICNKRQNGKYIEDPAKAQSH